MSFLFLVLAISGFFVARGSLETDFSLPTVATSTSEINLESRVPSKTFEGQWVLRDRLLAELVPGDPDSIFKVIDDIGANKDLSLDCHGVAHDLGHKAYELYGFSGSLTFGNPHRAGHASVQNICAGGYVHGIMEELFSHQPQSKNDPEALCGVVPIDGRESCFHGVGQALMFMNERHVNTSLGDCRVIHQQTAMLRCFEGVWMELFWGDTDHFENASLGWNPENPLASCLAGVADTRPTCLLYASSGYVRIHVGDYRGAVAMCTTNSLTESDEAFCLKGVGIAVARDIKGHSLDKAESFVEGLSAAQKLGFYKGMLKYALFAGVPEDNVRAVCPALKNDVLVCGDALDGI